MDKFIIIKLSLPKITSINTNFNILISADLNVRNIHRSSKIM